MARFDGAVLDAKPWGRGAQSGVQLPAVQSERPAEQALSCLEVRYAGWLPAVLTIILESPALAATRAS